MSISANVLHPIEGPGADAKAPGAQASRSSRATDPHNDKYRSVDMGDWPENGRSHFAEEDWGNGTKKMRPLNQPPVAASRNIL